MNTGLRSPRKGVRCTEISRCLFAVVCATCISWVCALTGSRTALPSYDAFYPLVGSTSSYIWVWKSEAGYVGTIRTIISIILAD